MPSPAGTIVAFVELALILIGGAHLWVHGLSPAARRQTPRLAAWDVRLSDFFLFLWLVILGALAAQFGLGLYQRFHHLDTAHYSIVGTGIFHAGMLLGMLVYRVAFTRPGNRQPFVFSGAVSSGVSTYLIALPVITVVSLLWQGLLGLFGIKVANQEAIDLLRSTHSDTLRFLLLSVAILVAPITEELIFRAGIFRFARTRLPRWAALLLPAVLFASLHANLGSFVPLIALAIVFSLAYERTGLIATTMVAHALFNLNASVLVLAGVNV